MTSARSVIDVAVKEDGTTESPANSNHTKYGVAYGLDREPWCAIFIWWVFMQLQALGLLHQKTAYTPTLAQGFIDAGQWGSQPKKGALVFYRFTGDRIDHVEEVIDYGPTWIKTVGGNTSPAADSGDQYNGGGVFVKTRPRNSLIAGYAYPAYKPAKPSKKKNVHFRRDLRKGDTGPDVLLWKHDLKRVGLFSAKLTKDTDHFGPGTVRATRAFQKKHALLIDGIAGTKTIHAMETVLRRK